MSRLVFIALTLFSIVASLNSADAQRRQVDQGPAAAQRASYVGGVPAGPPARYAGGSVFDGGCSDGSCADGNCAGGSCQGDSIFGNYDDPGYEGEEVISGDGDCCGCGDISCDGCCGSRFSAGVEFTFVKPHFENNLAFSELNSDGATFENSRDIEFDYSTELAPRVWVEILQMGSLGLRASYWQFDHAAANAVGMPADNGFGSISNPFFGTVDLSTTVPGSTYSAASALNAYNIDIEGTSAFNCGMWGWMATAGLRFAEIDQSYNSTLTNANGATQGTINFDHRIQGIGPTVSVRTQRPFTSQLSLFGLARGALLFGDSDSALNAVEDQDLDIQLNTQNLTARDDLLPIGEMQVGLQWTPPACGVWYPYLHIAMEGQLWNGAGNASSEEGNVGFYGFNFALGFDW